MRCRVHFCPDKKTAAMIVPDFAPSFPVNKEKKNKKTFK